VLLGLEGERVDVDADGGDVRVVLVGLHKVEVVALARLEAIVAVELEESRDDGVLASHALDTRDGVARLEDAAVPPVGEVEGLLALPLANDVIGARDERITLDNPHELLARVVEVELELVGRRRDGLRARELERLDEVLVRDLGELAALVRVEVDIVDVERGGLEVGRRDTVTDRVDVREVGRVVPAEVAEVVEVEVDADLVVLEGDERERKARVAAEPELEGDVERVRGGAATERGGACGLTGSAVRVARRTTLLEEVRELGDIANHLGIAGLLASLLRELIPDVEPVAVVLVDALATDLDLDRLDEIVANPVEPAELGARAVRGGVELDRGERRLEVHAVDEVTVALDRARHALAEARRAVERVLNGLHGEVRVAAVHDLEERDLGVAREVNILGAVGDKLHETTTRHLLYTPFLEINSGGGGFFTAGSPFEAACRR